MNQNTETNSTSTSTSIPAPTGATLIQKKRFTNELKLLSAQPLGYITAYPDETNPLIWYFLLVGQKGTQYYGGHYIGEIKHSPKYPAEPPDYYMRTLSGRYEINSKICLTNSGYHKGDWSSTWNIQSILIAFYSIWLDDTEHGISHIKRSAEERAKLATESKDYNVKNYKKIYEKFDFSTLTDDIDNAPKPKLAITNTVNVTVPVTVTVPVSVLEPIIVSNTNTIPEPIIVSNTNTNTNTNTIPVPEPIIVSNTNKFKEVYDNINKINEKINFQEENINNIIKNIK